MRLRLPEGDSIAQDGEFAFYTDIDGDEQGAVSRQAAIAHLLVACFENEVRAGIQGAVAQSITWVELTQRSQSSSTSLDTLHVNTPCKYTYFAALTPAGQPVDGYLPSVGSAIPKVRAYSLRPSERRDRSRCR